MNRKIYNEYVTILESELVPALGCTEPIALAYAAAKAKEVLGKMPDHITMRCSGNIIKNVKGVKVPNSGGMKGVEAAAVLGITGGDPSQALEVLEHVTDREIDEAEKLFRQIRPLEQKLLARFQQEQDAFVRIDWYGNVLYPHEICSANLRLLGGAVRNLKEQRLSSALRKLYQVDNNAYAFNFDEEVYRHFTDYVFHQPKDRLKWGYGRLPEHENLYGTVKQLLQKEKQLEMLTGSGMKEMDYREEITSLEHACSKLVVSLMNIVQQMERSVTEIFEL